jgi:hypothetical protein
MRRHRILNSGVVISLLLIAPVAMAWSPPTEKLQIAGTFTGSSTQRQNIEVADAPGHVLVLSQAKGSNRSTGPTDYMDGAEIVNSEIADLIQGNGTHQGYVRMSKGGESTVTKWSGKVTTVLSPEKTPITTFEGTWSKVNGSGRFAGVSGSGTYKGRMTSQTEYVVDWQGEIAGPKLAAR